MDTTISRLACVALLISFSAGARAGLFDDDEARKQIADQSKRLGEMQAQQKQQADDINARLAKLEEAMKSQALLDLLSQIDRLREDLNNLRGQVEVLGNNIDTTAKRQKDMYTDLDSRMRRMEQPATPGAPPGPTGAAPTDPGAGPAAAGATPPGAPAPGASPGDAMAEARAYDAAQNLRRIGNYQGAIVAFQNFVKQYPKSALASSAQYWIGDSYFNLRDFRASIANQQQLIKTYPDSQKVPDALLNIASAQVEMGDGGAARKTMQDLVSKYPVSDAAEKAKRRLATLK